MPSFYFFQVASVALGGLASRHGLQTRDLILAVGGQHLLSSSEPRYAPGGRAKFYRFIWRRDVFCYYSFKLDSSNPNPGISQENPRNIPERSRKERYRCLFSYFRISIICVEDADAKSVNRETLPAAAKAFSRKRFL